MIKKRFLWLVITLILILLIIILLLLNMQMVRGSAKNTDKVVIYISNRSIESSQIVFETPDELNEIFNILKNTKNIRFYKHQKDYGTLMHDREFRIEIYYSNGKIEILEPTERRGSLFKDIPFVRGYLIGNNEDIWDYIIPVTPKN